MATTKINLIIIAWGTLEVLLFGGIIFGWASLVYVFKEENIFLDKCNKFGELNQATNETTIYTAQTVTDSRNGTKKFPVKFISSHNNGSDTNFHIQCPPQDRLFNLIYVLAVVLNGVATFPCGVIWDKFGTRVLRVVSMITFVPGLLILITLTKDTSLLLFPAMILIAFGGYIILLTNFQLGNLWPNKKSVIISLYAGAYDSSAFMLVLVKWAYTFGVSTKYTFIVMLLLYATIITLSTFWFMPKYKIPFPLPPMYKLNFSCSRKKTWKEVEGETRDVVTFKDNGTKAGSIDNSSLSEPKHLSNSLLDVDKEGHKNAADGLLEKPKPPNFKTEVTSLLFISDVIWLTLMRLQSWSFVGRLNPVLDRLANGEQNIVSHYTSVYAGMQFFGMILAPLSGRLMDRKKNSKGTPALKRIETIEVCIASFIIDNTFGLLLAVTMTVPILEVQYVSFVFHVVHRALLYGPNSAFIAQAFSAQNFGKLFGLAMTVSAAVSLIQFPFFVLVQGPLNGDPLLFNIFILALMVLAYGHPIYLLMWCKKQRKEYLKIEQTIVDDKD